MKPMAETARQQMIRRLRNGHLGKPKPGDAVREDDDDGTELSAAEARARYLSMIRGEPVAVTFKPVKQSREDEVRKPLKKAYREDHAEPDKFEWFRKHLRKEGYSEGTIARMLTV